MRLLAFLTFVITVTANTMAYADWPSFLGGQERSSQTIAVPVSWSADSGVAWKTALKGHGQSSPVVVGSNVYLTAVDGPQKETFWVFCFDLKSGTEKWSHSLPSSLQVKNDPYTSRAAPTAAADASGVYAFFESGDLVALSPDGDVLWERKLMDDYGKYSGRFGLGGSVAQTEDKIFILADNEGPSYLLAINKADGKTAWKADRTSRTAWSSPMILEVDRMPQVVASSAGSVDGYNAATGDMLWSITDVGGNTVASPVPFGEACFLVGASPGRNGENTENAARSNMAVKIVKDGAAYKPEVLWRNPKATSSFGSPIVHAGNAYYVNRSGVVYCINAETGENVYTKRIKEAPWATPLGFEDRVYVFGQQGDTTVFKAGSEYEELAVNRLYAAKDGGPGGFNAEIQYGVALTDAGLLVRTGENLYLVSE